MSSASSQGSSLRGWTDDPGRPGQGRPTPGGHGGRAGWPTPPCWGAPGSAAAWRQRVRTFTCVWWGRFIGVRNGGFDPNTSRFRFAAWMGAGRKSCDSSSRTASAARNPASRGTKRRRLSPRILWAPDNGSKNPMRLAPSTGRPASCLSNLTIARPRRKSRVQDTFLSRGISASTVIFTPDSVSSTRARPSSLVQPPDGKANPSVR